MTRHVRDLCAFTRPLRPDHLAHPTDRSRAGANESMEGKRAAEAGTRLPCFGLLKLDSTPHFTQDWIYSAANLGCSEGAYPQNIERHITFRDSLSMMVSRIISQARRWRGGLPDASAPTSCFSTSAAIIGGMYTVHDPGRSRTCLDAMKVPRARHS
ncbi:hypothetical protein OH76DRAFT_300466 [Lentinus brumalis]|uniref:Uncharacterized protein n=1 Tax=Lentinus brumalis TaxID=2498619 RepID=A0A371DG48_9APHY|nr:hypothetical protein OH76DRAFT_300466 [Polyporus brumalis]